MLWFCSSHSHHLDQQNDDTDDTQSDDEALEAEIRALIENAGIGDDLSAGGTVLVTDQNADEVPSQIQNNEVNKRARKPVTAVISSPGYISVLKQAKEKKEAVEKKKKENREKRLTNAIENMKKAQTRIDKLKMQIINSK